MTLPYIVAAINEKLLYIFGACNAISIPIGKKALARRTFCTSLTANLTVWALYPESNQRTLEEMDMLFAAETPWVWDAESNFARLKEQNPMNQERRLSVDDAEKRQISIVHAEKVDLTLA